MDNNSGSQYWAEYWDDYHQEKWVREDMQNMMTDGKPGIIIISKKEIEFKKWLNETLLRGNKNGNTDSR